MSARLPSNLLAGALVRKAEAEGGFGVVAEKGDPAAGSILVILMERGRNPRIFERLLHPDGAYRWQAPGSEAIDNVTEVPALVASRRRFDPDLWVLELDVPSAERFAAEMNELG